MLRGILSTSCIIVGSIALAWWFGASGAAAWFISLAAPVPFLAAFLAGMGFSSLFTTASAAVVLVEMAQQPLPLLPFVACAAAGALVGDLALIRAMAAATRAADKPIAHVLTAPRFVRLHRLRATLSHGPFKFILFAAGAFIIASPFPDELGLALMGMSSAPLVLLAPVSFFANGLGILAIALLARAA